MAPELMEMPSPRAFVPGLPQSVDNIVMRALSDVEARFQDAEEMAAVGGNAAPKIEGFSASPKHLDEAGPIKLELVASDDVEVVKVHLELDGEKLAELTLADFPYTHDVLSAKDNGDKRAFKVTVEDGEGSPRRVRTRSGSSCRSPGSRSASSRIRRREPSRA